MSEKDPLEDDSIDEHDVPDGSMLSLQADTERILTSALDCRSELSPALKQEIERSIDRLARRSDGLARVLRKIFHAISENRAPQDPSRQEEIHAVQIDGVPESFWKRLKAGKEAVPADMNDTGAIDSFMQSACSGKNLLSLDRTLTRQQLEERIAILDSLIDVYTHANSRDVKRMRDFLIGACGIPTMSTNTNEAICRLETGCRISEGAENKNIFYLQDAQHAGVLKLTKGRHDEDFYSVLKLMRNMHAVALRLNGPLPDRCSRVEILFHDMTIFQDDSGNLKRIIRQQYAPGTPIKELGEEEKESPAFRTAWRAFLKTISGMKATEGVVPDMTDSDAGYTWERSNVAHTENVFVRREGEGYVFSIIDPDVFDTRDGEDKFDPLEYVRNVNGTINTMRGIWKVFCVAVLNGVRGVVADLQDSYVKEERKRGHPKG